MKFGVPSPFRLAPLAFDDADGQGINCFLAVDVWEHACYLDYQKGRPQYLEAMLADILSCDYASEYRSQQDEMVRARAP